MNKKYKWALSLGTVVAAATPIIAVVSCGDESSDDKNNEQKQTGTPSTGEIKQEIARQDKETGGATTSIMEQLAHDLHALGLIDDDSVGSIFSLVPKVMTGTTINVDGITELVVKLSEADASTSLHYSAQEISDLVSPIMALINPRATDQEKAELATTVESIGNNISTALENIGSVIALLKTVVNNHTITEIKDAITANGYLGLINLVSLNMDSEISVELVKSALGALKEFITFSATVQSFLPETDAEIAEWTGLFHSNNGQSFAQQILNTLKSVLATDGIIDGLASEHALDFYDALPQDSAVLASIYELINSDDDAQQAIKSVVENFVAGDFLRVLLTSGINGIENNAQTKTALETVIREELSPEYLTLINGVLNGFSSVDDMKSAFDGADASIWTADLAGLGTVGEILTKLFNNEAIAGQTVANANELLLHGLLSLDKTQLQALITDAFTVINNLQLTGSETALMTDVVEALQHIGSASQNAPLAELVNTLINGDFTSMDGSIWTGAAEIIKASSNAFSSLVVADTATSLEKIFTTPILTWTDAEKDLIKSIIVELGATPATLATYDKVVSILLG